MADFLIHVSVFLIGCGIVFCVIRLVIGRTLVDRIVAVDMLTIIVIVLIALYAHVAGRAAYLDVALVYGLLSFLAVLAIARFIDRGL
ncbi:monovalent cation/H+ antiporter complex subunit F [Dichotomicrobium thermohalophilum]|uniref:Multicomponent Na+:H+ antiporter subunit F n=1 Tax=Dichotomicrobium thermohalophilum TaxID=933063 RepID=A0A397Q2H9_9HYPH|nr:monovalent cation/H+ antiporter complex subunit F [Dichotomicrobium thermohalophilum]RIA55710.1 multicomponent Na+:H+ antiporter subunit F [Dichotomicrobium thermohalophilum]